VFQIDQFMERVPDKMLQRETRVVNPLLPANVAVLTD
jgi:hypothetical protein